MTSSLDHEILDHVSHLNALARFLARDRTLADDLVQETLLRALHYSEQFERGTNLKAWLTTILRNSYFNEKRSEARRRRLTQQGVLVQTEMRVAPGNQEPISSSGTSNGHSSPCRRFNARPSLWWAPRDTPMRRRPSLPAAPSAQ